MNDPLLLLCYMSILFAANVLGAVGGFGAGMISIPFLTQLFDAKAVIMASTMTCVLNLFIAVKNWRHVDLKRLFRILFYMCIGLPIGVYGLKTLDVDALKHLLGGFMLVIGGYGIMKLWIPRAAGVHLPAWALRGCLIAGGIVQGAISSGGSLILLYAQQELEEKNRFRATMALLWTIVSLITVLQYMLMGTLNRESLRLFAEGVLPVLSGIFAGGLLCRRLGQRAFAYVINILIMFAGMISLCR